MFQHAAWSIFYLRSYLSYKKVFEIRCHIPSLIISKSRKIDEVKARHFTFLSNYDRYNISVKSLVLIFLCLFWNHSYSVVILISIKILVYLQGLFLFIFPIYWLTTICYICDYSFKAPSIEQNQIGLTHSNDTIESNLHEGPNVSIAKNNHNRKNKNKFILYLSWEEVHRERKTLVVQNQYLGPYGTSPFKGETRLINKRQL